MTTTLVVALLVVIFAAAFLAVRRGLRPEPEATLRASQSTPSRSWTLAAAADMCDAARERRDLEARPTWTTTEGRAANAKVDAARTALLTLCGDGPALVAPGFVPSPPGAPSNLPEPRAACETAQPAFSLTPATTETPTISLARELARRFTSAPSDSAGGRVRVAIEGWFSDGDDPTDDD